MLFGTEGLVVMLPLEVEAGEVPAKLEALTLKEYVVPGLSPVTVIGDEVPVAVIPAGEPSAKYAVTV